MHLLPTNLAKLADLTGDDTRWATSAVHLRLHGDNTYVAEATNCRVAIRVSGPAMDVSEYPVIPAMAEAPNGCTDALIPAEVWRKVFVQAAKHTKRCYKPEIRSVAVKIGKDLATLGCTNGDSSQVEYTRLVGGKFPPVADCFPKRQRLSVRLDPDYLITILTVLREFATPDSDGDRVIRLEIDEPNQPMVFRTERLEQYAEALLMPMSGGNSSREKDGDGDGDLGEERRRLQAQIEELMTQRDEAKEDADKLSRYNWDLHEQLAAAKRGWREEVADLKDQLANTESRSCHRLEDACRMVAIADNLQQELHSMQQELDNLKMAMRDVDGIAFSMPRSNSCSQPSA